eukprot:m.463728 g.463728  ORF g.463728 m.463728 type:complete len:352 (+) comp23145_c0_seq1:162-1217(+)
MAAAPCSEFPSRKIPVVSVAALVHGTPSERDALGKSLCAICHDIGFFVAVDHGVSADLTDKTFRMMEDFFGLPEKSKRLIDKENSRHFRGWEPVGSERTNGRVDLREQIDVWTEFPAKDIAAQPPYLRLYGPNQWLPDEILANHRAVSEEWTAALEELARRLLESLWCGLGLSHEHFCQFTEGSMSLTKFIHYPPTPNGAAGVNAHKDTGFLTVLRSDTPGLQVMDSSGKWLDVPTVPGGFVVNLGENLQALTGGYLVATPHRVVTAQPRFSTAFFLGSALENSLDPLPLGPEYAAASSQHASPGFMATRDEIEEGVGDMQSGHRAAVYGEQLWNYFARSYPKTVGKYYGS